MALKNISSTSVKIYNPYGLYVKPFESENKPGSTYYYLGEVIRDTTTITQEDPTENKIENEFGSAPILNNVQLGSYTFSAEVADMQPELLEKLCGYSKDGAKTFAPSTYAPVFAEIALVFKTGDAQYVAAILPKVQLNSKATFDSLSTSMGRITLAGTGLNIAVGSTETPFYVDANYARPNEIALEVSEVKATSATVKAVFNGEKNVVGESAYSWKLNGANVDEKDFQYDITSLKAGNTYTVECQATRTNDGTTEWAKVTFTTPAT